MVLSETIIANTSLVSAGLSKRINLFEYFTLDNDTHIICNDLDQTMPKNDHPDYLGNGVWHPLRHVCTIH